MNLNAPIRTVKSMSVGFLVITFLCFFSQKALSQTLSFTTEESTCESNGSIMVTCTGCTPDTEFQITAGPICAAGNCPIDDLPEGTFASLPAGDYTVRAFNAGGVQVEANVAVPGSYQEPVPMADYSYACPGLMNGIINITGVEFGQGPYEYRAFVGVVGDYPGAIGPTEMDLPFSSATSFGGFGTGVHSYQVKDSCGVIRTGELVITDAPPFMLGLNIRCSNQATCTTDIGISYNAASVRLTDPRLENYFPMRLIIINPDGSETVADTLDGPGSVPRYEITECGGIYRIKLETACNTDVFTSSRIFACVSQAILYNEFCDTNTSTNTFNLFYANTNGACDDNHISTVFICGQENSGMPPLFVGHLEEFDPPTSTSGTSYHISTENTCNGETIDHGCITPVTNPLNWRRIAKCDTIGESIVILEPAPSYVLSAPAGYPNTLPDTLPRIGLYYYMLNVPLGDYVIGIDEGCGLEPFNLTVTETDFNITLDSTNITCQTTTFNFSFTDPTYDGVNGTVPLLSIGYTDDNNVWIPLSAQVNLQGVSGNRAVSLDNTLCVDNLEAKVFSINSVIEELTFCELDLGGLCYQAPDGISVIGLPCLDGIQMCDDGSQPYNILATAPEMNGLAPFTWEVFEGGTNTLFVPQIVTPDTFIVLEEVCVADLTLDIFVTDACGQQIMSEIGFGVLTFELLLSDMEEICGMETIDLNSVVKPVVRGGTWTATNGGPEPVNGVVGPVDPNVTGCFDYNYQLTPDNLPGICDDLDVPFTLCVCNAPISITCPDSLIVECDGSGNLLELENWIASAMSDDSVTANLVLSVPGNGVVSTNTYEFVADDGSGNTSVCTSIFIIEDTVLPVVVGASSVDTVSCEENFNVALDTWLNSIIATDTCATPLITSELVSVTESCDGTNSLTAYMYSVVAEDVVGNTSAVSMQTFYILDDVAPVIIAPEDLVIECGNENLSLIMAWINDYTVTEACQDFTVTNDWDGMVPELCDATDIPVTWTVTDGCGASSTATSNISVTADTAGPEFQNCPMAMTVNVDVDLCSANVIYSAPVATDCNGVSSVLLTSGPASGTAFPLGLNTIVFTATDECDNTSTCSFTITVVDSDIPTIACPSNLVEVCADDGGCVWASTAMIDPTSMENCPTMEITHTIVSSDGSIDVTDVNGLIAVGTAFPLGTTTITYRIQDGAGLTSECSFDVLVSDCEAPTLTCPMPTVVECDGMGNTADLSAFLLEVIGMDNCTDMDAVVITSQVFNSISGCGMTGITTYQFIAEDEAGNSSICYADFIIEDTTDPVIATAAVDETVECDGNGNISGFLSWLVSNGGITSAEVTEGCGDFEWRNNFSSVSFMSNATCAMEIGSWTVDFWVIDDCGNMSEVVTLSYIIEDTTAPMINAPSSITIECGSATNEGTIANWLNAFTTSDNCSDITVTNDYTAGSSPTTCGEMLDVIWTATDDCGNTSTAASSIEMVDDEKPIIMNAPLPLYAECGGATTPSDIADWLSTGGGALVIDNCDTLVEFTSTLEFESGDCIGSQVMVYSFTYTDNCDNSITTNSYIELIDTTAPVFDALASDLNVICDGSGNANDLNAWLNLNGGAIAIEECSSVLWSYNLISSINLCGDTGTDVYVFTASDDCGNMVSDTAEFTIMASEITLAGGADYETECADSNAGNDDELLSWLNNNAGITGENACGNLIWTNNFDVANWIDGCNDGRNIDVTFFATDDCGNMDSLTFNFSTSDNSNPEFINCPLEAYVFEVPAGSCEAYANFSLPIAEDNCGTPTVVQTDTTGLTSGSLFPLGLTVLEFTATDDCGNSSTCVVNIQINDLSYNLIAECPENLMTINDLGECGAEVDSIGLEIIDNNCGIDSEISFDITNSDGDTYATGMGDASGSFFQIGRSDITYTIVDQEGNIDSCTFSIFVSDIEAPTCASTSGAIYSQMDTTISISDLDCGAEFEWTHPIFSDNCTEGSMEITYDFVDTITGATNSEMEVILSESGNIDSDGEITSRIFPVGVTTVTYILTDAAGNIGLCSFIVNVEANEAPEFNAGCEDITISLDPGDCYAAINPPIDLSNTCGIDTVVYSINGEPIDLNQIPIGTTNITIDATDIYGNIGTCSFNITVLEFANTTTVIGCNNNLNVSLGASCEAIITPDMILEGGPYGCYENFCMEIIDADGNIVDNIFDLEDVGSIFSVSIIDCNGDGNSCWGYVTIENKLIPELECPADVTLTCNQDPNELYPAGHPLAGELVYGIANLETCEIDATITYKDELQDFGECSDPRVELTRTWTVKDDEGNEVSCEQKFDFLPFDPMMVEYPQEYILDNSFDCSEVDADPSLTEPESTGYPTFGGQPIIGNNFCDIHLGYWDEVLIDVNCPSAYIIYRNWKIDNECLPIEEGVNPLEFIQRIKVKDSKAPEISGLDDVTINVDPWSCEGTYTLPNIMNTDDCSEFEVEWHATYGQIVGNQVTNLLKGETVINVKVKDGCGNQSFGSFTITAVDLNPPTIISETQHTVSLSQDGIAKLYATSLDDGSYDGCGDIGMMVMRMDAGGDCAPQDYFEPAGDDNAQLNEIVHFCCSDVGPDPIMVQFRVCDDADLDEIFGSEGDNCNLVMVEVFVQEKLAPQIICPDPVTISCIDLAGIDFTDTDLIDELFGTAEAAGTCDVTITQTAVGNEVCGAGVVFRNFTASNSVGTTSCQQIITVTAGPDEQLSCDRISFESISNTTYNWCLVNDNTNDVDDDLPAIEIDCNDGLEIPNLVFDINGLCTQVGEQITVDTFNFAGGACKKYVIHYEVIDQCVFDENYVDPTTGEVDPYNSDNGYFELYLEVDAFDTEEPEPDCSTLEFTAQSCSGFVGSFGITGTDNCTDAAFLGYQWRLDVGADNMIDYPAIGWFNSTEVSLDQIGLSEFPIGQHTVFWIISDGCGNDATCAQTINVFAEDKEPTPYCHDGLSVAVMPANGTVALWANDFDAGSFDNCAGELTLTMIPESDVDGLSSLEAYAQSFNHPNVTQQANGDFGFEFDCSYIPNGITAIFEVRMYVTDADGNWDYCTASLRLDDNFDACDNNGMMLTYETSGTLKTEYEEDISQVNVEVNASFPEFPMNEMFDGSYSFDLMEYIDYTITPSKNDDFLNGISTLDLVLIQKHILGLEILNSSYQLIAADVNSDCIITGVDLIQLRRLLLGKYENDILPENTSWRFVEGDYQFVDPTQPCNYNEASEIFNMSADEINDFVGVKIGDVNGSAETNLVGQENNTRSVDPIQIQLKQRESKDNNVIVDFVAMDQEEVYGFQFNLDLTNTEFVDVKSGELDVKSNNIGFSASNQTIYFSYDNSNGVSIGSGDVLFSIEVNKNQLASLSRSIKLNEYSFADEAYVGLDLRTKSIAFNYANEINEVSSIELYQNEPNPFVDKTKIMFSIPKTGNVRLSIYDVNGKELYQLENSYPKGMNEILLSKKDLQSSGVLYYKVEMGSYVATKKMIVLID